MYIANSVFIKNYHGCIDTHIEHKLLIIVRKNVTLIFTFNFSLQEVSTGDSDADGNAWTTAITDVLSPKGFVRVGINL